MIELLIVIVVLGILAAVVIFALGGITGKTAASSCSADGATVSSALAAFNNQNPGVLNGNAAGSATAATMEGELTATALGGPYIQSWPSNLPHYAFQLGWSAQLAAGTYNAIVQVSTTPVGAVVAGGPWVTYTGPSTCGAVQ